MGHGILEGLGMDLLTLHTLLNKTLRPGQQPLSADLAWPNTKAKWRDMQHSPETRSMKDCVVQKHEALHARPTSFVARWAIEWAGLAAVVVHGPRLRILVDGTKHHVRFWVIQSRVRDAVISVPNYESGDVGSKHRVMVRSSAWAVGAQSTVMFILPFMMV